MIWRPGHSWDNSFVFGEWDNKKLDWDYWFETREEAERFKACQDVING